MADRKVTTEVKVVGKGQIDPSLEALQAMMSAVEGSKGATTTGAAPAPAATSVVPSAQPRGFNAAGIAASQPASGAAPAATTLHDMLIVQQQQLVILQNIFAGGKQAQERASTPSLGRPSAEPGRADSLMSAGAVASSYYARGLGEAMNLVGAASPTVITTYQESWKLLEAEIGMGAIPAMMRMSGWLQTAARGVRGLNDETKIAIGNTLLFAGMGLRAIGTLGDMARGVVALRDAYVLARGAVVSFTAAQTTANVVSAAGGGAGAANLAGGASATAAGGAGLSATAAVAAVVAAIAAVATAAGDTYVNVQAVREREQERRGPAFNPNATAEGRERQRAVDVLSWIPGASTGANFMATFDRGDRNAANRPETSGLGRWLAEHSGDTLRLFGMNDRARRLEQMTGIEGDRAQAQVDTLIGGLNFNSRQSDVLNVHRELQQEATRGPLEQERFVQQMRALEIAMQELAEVQRGSGGPLVN